MDERFRVCEEVVLRLINRNQTSGYVDYNTFVSHHAMDVFGCHISGQNTRYKKVRIEQENAAKPTATVNNLLLAYRLPLHLLALQLLLAQISI